MYSFLILIVCYIPMGYAAIHGLVVNNVIRTMYNVYKFDSHVNYSKLIFFYQILISYQVVITNN